MSIFGFTILTNTVKKQVVRELVQPIHLVSVLVTIGTLCAWLGLEQPNRSSIIVAKWVLSFGNQIEVTRNGKLSLFISAHGDFRKDAIPTPSGGAKLGKVKVLSIEQKTSIVNPDSFLFFGHM